MNRISLYTKVLGILSLFFLFIANVSAVPSIYVEGGHGKIARDGFGGCAHAHDWKPELDIPECSGKAAEVKKVAKSVADSDGDGVADSKDRCPGTASGKRVDVYGCELKSVTSLKGVNFENNSAQLATSSTRALDDVAATLKKNSDVSAEVAGHTDGSGSRSYNVSLSNRRAQTVRQYLIDKGVDAGRLTAKGYGPDHPVTSNSTKEGRAKNRRVELRINK